MEADKGFFKETRHLIETYIEERLLLLKFQAAARTAGIVSTLIVGFCMGLLLFLILLCVSALGVYSFGRLTGSWYAGLLIVIAFYILAALLVYAKRNALRKYFSDLIVSLFFSDSSTTSDDSTPQ